jgi:hypothetical protein
MAPALIAALEDEGCAPNAAAAIATLAETEVGRRALAGALPSLAKLAKDGGPAAVVRVTSSNRPIR